MRTYLFLFVALVGFSAVGCGPSNDVTVSPVDDSVVHSEEQMQAMEEQNAADMQSQ